MSLIYKEVLDILWFLGLSLLIYLLEIMLLMLCDQQTNANLCWQDLDEDTRSIYQICYLFNSQEYVGTENNQENCSDNQAHLPRNHSPSPSFKVGNGELVAASSGHRTLPTTHLQALCFTAVQWPHLHPSLSVSRPCLHLVLRILGPCFLLDSVFWPHTLQQRFSLTSGPNLLPYSLFQHLVIP